MKYLLAFFLLFACSQPVEQDTVKEVIVETLVEPNQSIETSVEKPTKTMFDTFLNKSYDEIAVTYIVDAPAIGINNTEISIYKKIGSVKLDYLSYSYFPLTKRFCSEDVCRELRIDTEPDTTLLELIKVFYLADAEYGKAEFNGIKQAGDRICHRFLVPTKEFEHIGPNPILDICIDQQTSLPLYATILSDDKPVIIWSLTSVEFAIE